MHEIEKFFLRIAIIATVILLIGIFLLTAQIRNDLDSISCGTATSTQHHCPVRR